MMYRIKMKLHEMEVALDFSTPLWCTVYPSETNLAYWTRNKCRTRLDCFHRELLFAIAATSRERQFVPPILRPKITRGFFWCIL